MPLTSSATAALIAILIIPLSSATPIKSSLVTTLTIRDLQVAGLGLPNCDTKDTDPTWAQGQSNFKEGDGVKISDDCDNGLGGSDHCW